MTLNHDCSRLLGTMAGNGNYRLNLLMDLLNQSVKVYSKRAVTPESGQLGVQH